MLSKLYLFLISLFEKVHFYIFVMLIELVSVRLPSINLNQKEDENDHLQGNLKQQKKDFDTLGSMQIYRLDAQGPLARR